MDLLRMVFRYLFEIPVELFALIFCNPLGLAAVAICWPLGIALCKYTDPKLLLCFDIACICFALIGTYYAFVPGHDSLYAILFFYPASIILTIIYFRQVRKKHKK